MSEYAYRKPDVSLLQESHVEAYLETDGRVGHVWNGVTCLILTTTGRRTGKPRRIAIIYTTDGDDYIVVASNAGSTGHPLWYLNLVASPEVEVQVLGERFRATASTATGAERARLWLLAARQWPNYDTYVTRTDREIPVVVLRPHR